MLYGAMASNSIQPGINGENEQSRVVQPNARKYTYACHSVKKATPIRNARQPICKCAELVPARATASPLGPY
eukprot:6186981-Pleurochrysis_carterae.AAC.2